MQVIERFAVEWSATAQMTTVALVPTLGSVFAER